MATRAKRPPATEATAAKVGARNLRVIPGRRNDDGAACVLVESQSRPNTWHNVLVLPGRLSCDCPAAQHGQMCVHRTVARVFLLQRLQERQAPPERAQCPYCGELYEIDHGHGDESVAEQRWNLTDKGRAALILMQQRAGR